MRLFWDTETTDYWEFKKSVVDPEQPMVAQIAAVLESDSGRTVAAVSAIIAQHMWPCDDDIKRCRPRVRISKRCTDVHGITDEMVDMYGQSPQLVVDQLRRMVQAATEHVGHNVEFDVGVMDNTCRVLHVPKFAWPKKFCTMKESTSIVNGDRGKWPKLSEAYTFFTGRELSGAHDALVDVYGCRSVFRSIQKHRSANSG